MQPSIISLHIFLYSFIPLLQILLELLANSLLELHLLDVQSKELDCVDDLDVGERFLASHVGVDVEFEPSDVVHVLVIDLGLLHLVVEYAVLEGLEHLVPHVDVDVQLLDVCQQVHADQLALRLLDLLQVLGFEHSDQAPLVQPHHLELHLGDGLDAEVAAEESYFHSSPNSRVVVPVSQDLEVDLDGLAQLELRLSVYKHSDVLLLLRRGRVLACSIDRVLALACILGEDVGEDGHDRIFCLGLVELLLSPALWLLASLVLYLFAVFGGAVLMEKLVRSVGILVGLVVVGKHAVLHGAGVGGEQLVEEAADQLVDVLLQRADCGLLLVLELVVLEVQGALLHLLLPPLHVLVVVYLDDLAVEATDPLLVDAVVALGVH